MLSITIQTIVSTPLNGMEQTDARDELNIRQPFSWFFPNRHYPVQVQRV